MVKESLLSIIIPVFNEEPGIPALNLRLLQFIQNYEKTIICIEVIFVDDHSSDNSYALLKEIADKDDHFHVLRLSNNCGSHIAIIAGMKAAKGNCAIFLAADLQDPPELIIKLVEEWGKGSKVVWAVRQKREGIPLIELFFSKVYYYIFNKIAHVKLPKSGSDFALLDKVVVTSLLESIGSNPSLGALIVSLGYKQSEILYTKEQRKFGKSKWTLSKKINAFLDSIIAFSQVPMRLMIAFGFAIAISGFLYAILIVILHFSGKPILGWSSLIIVVLLLGGIQMMMIGVIGEYLWRNLEESRKKPLYFIEEKSDNI